MHDRGQFWSPVPDWAQVALHADGVDIAVVNATSVCLVSGDVHALLAQKRIGEMLGPRQRCEADSYALRLSPDRCLLVSDASAAMDHTGLASGCAVTDVSDGIMIFDIRGDAAANLMAQGSEYPFEGTKILPQESASMHFAGFRVIVSRREHGWRLHVDRPWAPALWRWFEAHVEAA